MKAIKVPIAEPKIAHRVMTGDPTAIPKRINPAEIILSER